MAEQIVGLGKLQKRIEAISDPRMRRQYLGRLGLAAVREAKYLAPRKTSNLSRTIKLGTVTPETATIEATAPYAGYVEHGTRPHVIRPRNKKALRWGATAADRRLSGSPRKGADVVFATHVDHPGTRAQPFLRPGAEKAIERAALAEDVVKSWNDAA